MKPDEIVEEMRNHGLAFMARYGHDMAAACEALRVKQQASTLAMVNRESEPARVKKTL